METFLIGIGIGLVGAGSLYISLRRMRARKGPSGPSVEIRTFITSLQAVSELTVFRVRTEKILTASDHWFGDVGRRYFSWLFSEKRMTMVFEFDVDFRYNLLSPDFHVHTEPGGAISITLPPCSYDVRIINMRLHSEKKTELLPWLLPDVLERFVTGDFSVDAKNKLIDEAKNQAVRLAGGLVADMERLAQTSARKTLEMLARGFGADRITVSFVPSQEFEPHVDASRILPDSRPDDIPE